jgi:predicted RNA-binding Zn ribbon-like protein
MPFLHLAYLRVTCQGGDVGVVFVSGNLALDYIGTLNERNRARVEQLTSPRDLGAWLVAAGILDSAPPVTIDDLVHALAVREAIFAVIAREIDQSTPRPTRTTRAERTLINAAAAEAPPVPALSTVGRVTHRGDLIAGLSAIARDAIALFDRDDGSVLKWCADPDCTHPFLDRSRGHRRRWCDMAGCGDRAKAAAYRARQRESSSVDH